MFFSRIQCVQISLLFVLLLAKYSILMPIHSNHNLTENDSNNSSILQQSNNKTDRSDAVLLRRSADRSSCSCKNDQNTTCLSLREALYEELRTQDIGDEIPYHFFSLKDLLYFDLIDIDNDTNTLSLLKVDQKSESGMRDIADRCDSLLNNYSPEEEGGCRWTYECEQNLDQFPSFRLKAVLEEGTECKEKRAIDKRFVRTECNTDATASHWKYCTCEEPTVIGYEAEF